MKDLFPTVDNQPQEQAWISKALAARQEKGAPSQEDIATVAQEFVDDIIEEQQNPDFDMNGGMASEYVKMLNDLRIYAHGKTSPVYTEPASWDQGVISNYLPEDFKKLVELIYKDLYERGSVQPWVQKAELAKSGITSDPEGQAKHSVLIDRLVDFYRDKRQEDPVRYSFRGAGRDLIMFALGQEVVGHSPMDMSPQFENLTPEDFAEIYSRAEVDTES